MHLCVCMCLCSGAVLSSMYSMTLCIPYCVNWMVLVCTCKELSKHSLNATAWGFLIRMVYLYCISCLRCTILVGNPCAIQLQTMLRASLFVFFFKCLVGCFSMIVWIPAVLSVLCACVLYFCICTCSAQLSNFTWKGALEIRSLLSASFIEHHTKRAQIYLSVDICIFLGFWSYDMAKVWIMECSFEVIMPKLE